MAYGQNACSCDALIFELMIRTLKCTLRIKGPDNVYRLGIYLHIVIKDFTTQPKQYVTCESKTCLTCSRHVKGNIH